jgi:hypothetical protein
MNNNTQKADIELLKKYPNIPSMLIDYFQKAFKMQERLSPINNAFKKHPEETCVALNSMFITANEATGLSSEELFINTDIGLKDLSPERIESSLAEIRAINFLYHKDFKNIKLLKSSKKRKADLTASKSTNNYAIEVTTSIQTAHKRKCSEWILTKLNDDGKLLQLEETANTLVNSRKMLICVINTEEIIALNTYSSFLSIAKTVWEQSGKIKDFHVCIITGMRAEGHKLDDCIYPDLL